jgi:DNA-binding Lrp family transcriptional regulator
MTDCPINEGKLRNFTPLMDILVQRFGLVTAAVYGRVWRYAQGDDRVCRAAHEKIADELNIDRRTVIRHLKTLCDVGYLEDRTPELKNKPHTYRVTDKIRIVVTVEAVTENDTEENSTVIKSHSTVTESHSHGDLKSLEETNKKQVKKGVGGIATANHEFEEPPDDKPAGIYAPFEQVFIEETGLPIMSGGPQRWYEGMKRIAEAGATPEDFRQAIREQLGAAQTGKRYNANSPQSFVNATLNVIAYRNAKPSGNGNGNGQKKIIRRLQSPTGEIIVQYADGSEERIPAAQAV